MSENNIDIHSVRKPVLLKPCMACAGAEAAKEVRKLSLALSKLKP
ncbi:hypothetical protein [Leeuwenhoekiella marinoflava]|nr:hypothetical protein [Leeuwenhoekiella marinoflava]